MEWRASLPVFDRVKYRWKSPAKFVVFENGTDHRFAQFVLDFVGGGASGAVSGGAFPAEPTWTTGHVHSMTGVLTTLSQTKLTAYLPSLHNLDVEFPKMLMDNCEGLPAEMGEPFNVSTVHDSKVDEQGFYSSAKRVWAAGEATARALCSIHAMDYACYDKVPVPIICQQVFLDERFVDRVMRAHNTTAPP